MSDHPALITFSDGWGDSHTTSADGMPVYVDTVMITIERPPLLKLHRQAIAQDFKDHPLEYEAFLAVQKAKRNTGEEGYPLVYWPAATAADVAMLAARKITTVEQVAALAGDRTLPGQLADLALRAERMMDMQKQFGKYEAMLHERDAQLVELNEQVKDLQQSLSAANSVINTLKMRVA
jgi:hypothetical protein